MGTVCPQGHDSAGSDFCDVCGTRISSSLSRADGMIGKHHAAGRFVASAGDSCPRCGSVVTGQFCEACGFRVSARRPFAPLGHQAEPSSPAPAGAWETSPSGTASSGPPESLFPPVPKPEPPFSAWSRPQSPPPPVSPPPVAPPPPAPAEAQPVQVSRPEPPTGPQVRVEPAPVVRAEPAPAPRPEPSAPQSWSKQPAPPARPEPPPPVASRPDLTASAVRPAASAPPTTPIPSLTRVTWTVLVAADHVYYNRMLASGGMSGSAVEFPAHTSERRIRLVGKQMRIGRRSAARDLVPEIDLADQPVDPGVSRLHAVLTYAPDGTWYISDPGSANGTLVNGLELSIGEAVTLHEGDRINLGAWTVITVHRG
jgi:hypothetical protein